MCKGKLIVSTLLTTLLCFGIVINSYADTSVSSVTDRSYSSSYLFPNDYMDTNVSYSRNVQYTVTIPKAIVLDGASTNPVQNFNVTCKGDIPGGGKIKVYSDKAFPLTQEGKRTVLCTVGYDHTFYYDFINTEDGETYKGNVTVPTNNGNTLSAGTYSGMFNFYINYYGNTDISGADANTKTTNIDKFIEANLNIDKQIAFSFEDNKCYVKSGYFTSGTRPDFSTDSTCIYECDTSTFNDYQANYKTANNLGNVMNYILYRTLGTEYKHFSIEFPYIVQSGSKTLSSTIYIDSGFYKNYAAKGSFVVYAAGDDGYFGYDFITPASNSAVWFGKPLDTREPIVASDVPSFDSYSLNENIATFINENRDTVKQVGFQSDRNGKFYVGTGVFTQGVNPDIITNGTLIYDTNGASVGSDNDNLKCAVNLSNIMNFILYYTKGEQYGSSVPILTDTTGTYQSADINKGFPDGYGVAESYGCDEQSCAGYYENRGVDSSGSSAVWWGIIDEDSYSQTANIQAFISANKNTDKQVGFQSDAEGNFYVGVGNFTAKTNPNIDTNGTLIYSCDTHLTDDKYNNYEHTANLCNIMNYILSQTLGSKYNPSSKLFDPRKRDVAETYLNQYRYMNYGFYKAQGQESLIYTECQGIVSYYNYARIRSDAECAVWFKK